MSADKDVRRGLREAYREAWADRAVSGAGDEVLRARLRAHHVDAALDETTPLHRVVFDFWRRDVPPHRLLLEAVRLLGRAAGLSAAAAAVYQVNMRNRHSTWHAHHAKHRFTM